MGIIYKQLVLQVLLINLSSDQYPVLFAVCRG